MSKEARIRLKARETASRFFSDLIQAGRRLARLLFLFGTCSRSLAATYRSK
ncbi:hypothetical protein [Amycolatopsis alba]|uniref:hypothetical protein n=1 Tax=Amycolatopsis alba TaxID=76020 RepID=UPI000364C796|nr:hypothetical protein [Amycolatopsis alba]